MAKLSPMMILPPVLFAGLALMFLFGMNRDDPNALPSTRIGKVTPALDLEPMAGMPLLDDAVMQAPGVKLVNFWGSWCVACRAEHAQLLHMKNELGLSLHGINYNEPAARGEAYLQQHGNPFVTLGWDGSRRNTIEWGVYGAPETFIVDGDGVVTLRFAGPITESILENVILPAIQKAANASD